MLIVGPVQVHEPDERRQNGVVLQEHDHELELTKQNAAPWAWSPHISMTTLRVTKSVGWTHHA